MRSHFLPHRAPNQLQMTHIPRFNKCRQAKHTAVSESGHATLLLLPPMLRHDCSAVQQFYQKLHIPPDQIEYTTTSYCLDKPETPEQRFVCTVKLPRVVLDDAGVVREVLGEEYFQGEGKRKVWRLPKHVFLQSF